MRLESETKVARLKRVPGEIVFLLYIVLHLTWVCIQISRHVILLEIICNIKPKWSEMMTAPKVLAEERVGMKLVQPKKRFG